MQIYHKLIKNNASFKTFTGLSVKEFNILTKQFGMYYKHLNNHGRHHTLSESRYALFFILFYLRHYCTQDVMSVFFNVDQSQISRWIYLLAIPLKQCSHFQLRKNDYKRKVKLTKNKINFLVDATERQIQRPSVNNKAFYSGKKKMHTIKNQILLDEQNLISHVSPTYSGKTHDMKVFRNQKYPKHINFLGDLGYIGESNIITPHKFHKKLNKDQKSFNKTISSIRCSVEHVFAWMKNFKILSSKFRGSFSLANHSFIIIAGLYNFSKQLKLK